MGERMSPKSNPSNTRARKSVTVKAAWIGGGCAIAAAIIGPLLAYGLPSTSTAPSASAVPSATPSVPDAPTVSVRRLSGLLGDGTGLWIVTKPPQDLPPLPTDETGVEQWVAKTNAIDSGFPGGPGITNLQVTIQGRSSTQIILTGIDFVTVHRQVGKIQGGVVANEGAGPLTFRYIEVNLDSKPIRIIHSYPNAFAGPSDPPWQRTPIRFPYFVTDTNSETFNIIADTHSDVTWYAELLWSVNGKNGESIISNGGKPFETAIASRATAEYKFNGHSWQVLPQG